MSADVLRLVAASSVAGPNDLADLARLLNANGMSAAAWLVEQAIEDLDDWDRTCGEYEDEAEKDAEKINTLTDERDDAKSKIGEALAIEQKWREGRGEARYAFAAMKKIREILEDETG